MINNRQNGRRGRGRNNGPRPQGGAPRPEQGNRIDNRARGNASQLHEKYKTLARDSQMAGDRVLTEYYLQFADHYFRVLSESRARFEEQRPQRQDARDGFDDYDGDEAEGEIGDERAPPRRDERPRYEEARRDEPRREDRSRDDTRQDGRRDERNRDDARQDGRREDRPRDEARQDGRREDRPRDERPRDERPRDEGRYERRERAPRAEQPQPQPVEAAAAPEPAVSDEAPAPRPRRGRLPRAAAPVEHEAEPRFDMAVLPPSIAPVAPAAEAAEGEEAPKRPRRTRRPRVEAGENDASGDVAA